MNTLHTHHSISRDADWFSHSMARRLRISWNIDNNYFAWKFSTGSQIGSFITPSRISKSIFKVRINNYFRSTQLQYMKLVLNQCRQQRMQECHKKASKKDSIANLHNNYCKSSNSKCNKSHRGIKNCHRIVQYLKNHQNSNSNLLNLSKTLMSAGMCLSWVNWNLRIWRVLLRASISSYSHSLCQLLCHLQSL